MSRPVGLNLIVTVAVEVDACKMGTCSMLIWPCKKVLRIDFKADVGITPYQRDSLDVHL
jgi:hypothetical protein